MNWGYWCVVRVVGAPILGHLPLTGSTGRRVSAVMLFRTCEKLHHGAKRFKYPANQYQYGMTPNIPATDEPRANSAREAVAVSQWGRSKAIAIGDESKDEWIVAPQAIDLKEVA